MNYEIIDLRLDKGLVTRGERKGQPWEGVRATVRRQTKGLIAAEQSRERSIYFFKDAQVSILKAFIGKKGGNAAATFEENQALPEEYRIQEHGFEVQVDMGGDFCRIYTADIVDSEGRLLHKAGTRRVNANGDLEPATRTMTVLAFKIEDPDPYAERPWTWSEDPEVTMRQIRDRYYRPLEAFQDAAAPVAEASSDEAAPEVSDVDAQLAAKQAALAKLQAEINGATQAH